MSIFDRNFNNSDLENYSELNKPIIYNIEILTEIIENSDNKLFEIYPKKDIIKLIELYSDNIYYNTESDEYISNNDSYESELLLLYNPKLFRISSDSYNILTLLKLFDELYDEFKPYFKLYENSENRYKYNSNELIELYDEILSELFSKNLFRNYFSDTEYKSYNLLLENIRFKINISDNNILSNNHLYLNDELLDSEIYSLLIDSDLDSSGLYELTYYNSWFNNRNNKSYLSDILKIDYSDEINKYILFENSLINFYNSEISSDMNYTYENKPNSFYKNNIEYYLEFSLNDLMKFNKIISESESESYDLIFNINDSDNKNIFKLFENTNNSIDSDSFIYGIIENIDELLYNEFYDSYYYELVKINSESFNYLKITDIYELKKIILNRFKHYNLNNSFKFSDELYDIN